MTLLVPVLVLCSYGALGLTSAARHEPPIHEEDIDRKFLCQFNNKLPSNIQVVLGCQNEILKF